MVHPVILLLRSSRVALEQSDITVDASRHRIYEYTA